ncbi:viral late transcription factor VLTF-4 [Cotia virus SPAn232]|uniref:Viral late transcription factor VLTF-4 n=1 Tax=Cotia virus TaxID=39444 RepID=H6TA66_9POXV|nr:viral late transcription factor VLTF-4 [Cotia virus SPAn232]ADT91106.2 viral late transcription factor VLTF-4 [Cotia virus SPAn232]
MAWSMNLGNGGDSFKTLEEIRAHLKSTTEESIDKNDDIFPEDIIIPPKNGTRPKKTVVKKPQRASKKDIVPEYNNVEENDNFNDNENNDDDDNDIKDDSNDIISGTKPKKAIKLLSKKTNQDDDTDDDKEKNTINDDIKLVIDSISENLKLINKKVQSVSVVLSEIQIASVNRNFSSLSKSVNELKNLGDGEKELVSSTKKRVTKKK